MSNSITLKDLLEAGAHFGHQARRWNPAMQRFIYDKRSGVHIFDLAKTKEGIDKACEFVHELSNKGGVILFVGTKRQAAGFIKEQALRTGMPYVSLRWMGGTLTNFAQISKRIQKLATLKDQREKGELKKYTKYEQLQFDREIAKLERFLGGLSGMSKLPDALFVADTHKEEVSVLEAKRMNIPVVGMVDSNGNPDLVDYIIPINDDAVNAVEMVIKAVADSITKPGASEKEAPAKAEKKAKEAAAPVADLAHNKTEEE